MTILRVETSMAIKDIAGKVYHLFHGGAVEIEGYKIYVENPLLPVPHKMNDHVLWKFERPMKVSTPGPDSSIVDIKQFRDRVEFDIGMWATVTVRFT